MSSKVYSAVLVGIETHIVEIEVDIATNKKPGIFIIGLPDAAIQESRKRLSAAFKHIGVDVSKYHITLNLAPADLKKSGAYFDFPMAVAILRACGIINPPAEFLEETIFCGEIGLDGGLRPTSRVFAFALDAKNFNKTRLVVPAGSHIEMVINGVEIICVGNLCELISYFNEGYVLPKIEGSNIVSRINDSVDFVDVKGQYQAKRALQIAAAGNHHTIFMGPPGSGKTMLAERLSTIMEPLSIAEMIELNRIYSSVGSNRSFMSMRPFRSPHHTVSYAGLVGGGSPIQAGEITLAHLGVLFLDEITEFSKKTLESLRQPLESKSVSISRANSFVKLPANFLLIAAFNPCPCGFAGEISKRCTCSKVIIDNYVKRLSGPLLDRIDLQLMLSPVKTDQVFNKSAHKTSAKMRAEIAGAVEMQKQRGIKNGDIPAKMIDEYCPKSSEAQRIIEMAFEKLNLSMRGYHKLLRVSRTIADIDGKDIIEASHVKEALSYRQIDQRISQLIIT